MLWVPDCAERTFVSEFAGSPRWHLPSDVRLDTMHFDPYTVRTHKLDIILKISYKRSPVLRHIFQRVELTSKKILPQFGKGPSIPCLSLGSRRTFCRWTCSISTRSRRRLSWTHGYRPNFKWSDMVTYSIQFPHLFFWKSLETPWAKMAIKRKRERGYFPSAVKGSLEAEGGHWLNFTTLPFWKEKYTCTLSSVP